MNDKGDNCYNGFFYKLIKAIATSAIISIFSLSLALAAHTQQAQAQDKTIVYHGARQLDYHDALIIKESTERMVWIAALAVILLAAAVVTYRTSKTKDEIVKKVEDESNEVKSFQATVIQRLLESISDQMKKELFQTIAQGQAALWKER